MPNRRQFLKLALVPALAPAVFSLLACDGASKFSPIPRGAKVVALGDSLTFGYGAESHQAYPVHLAAKTGWQIDNAGVNGDTTANVLARMDAVVAVQPALVLLGVGGNDVLRRVDKVETKQNLNDILTRLKTSGVPVVLIAEPHFSVSALFGKVSDNPVYKTVATAQDVPLFENGWSQILSDERLKSDQIHANAQGYAKFAELLYVYLQQLGYAV